MTIAEDLTRIQTAKSELKASIEAKGVTVPADKLIDDYAALINTMDTPHWLGANCELVDSGFYEESYVLDDTSFPSWTASTTAAVMVAAKNADTFVADMEKYEYWLKWTIDFTAAFLAGATLKAMPRRQTMVIWLNLHRRPSNLANVETMTDNYNYCTSAFTASSLINYYNTSGANTMATGISYGFYGAATAATFSSTTSLKPTVTRKTPALDVRCNSSYFATSRKAGIDTANSTWKVRGDMYRVKNGTSAIRNFYREAFDVFNNPL